MKTVLLSIFIIAVTILFSNCNSNNQTEKSISDNISKTYILDSTLIYIQTLKSDSLNDDVRLRLATKYYVGGEFEKAIFHFLKVFAHDDKNLKAIVSLGNLYYDTQQNEKAIEFYQKSLTIDSMNINVRCDMATCYLNIKQPYKALNILKENIEINPDHIQSHHNLAVVYNKLGMTKEAEEENEIFIRLSAK